MVTETKDKKGQEKKAQQDKLKKIKKNIENSHSSFIENYHMFDDMRRFVFLSAMDENDISVNMTIGRPSVEFPVLESYISRLMGEFSKNTPSIEVGAKDGKKADPDQIRAVEDHIRYTLFEANIHGFEYNMYRDTLSGGFSGAKVYTDYTNDKAFHQDIFVERVFDPTMTYWDPMARADDKSDGRYCGQNFPMTKDEFLEMFGKEKEKDFNHSDGVGGFRWNYRDQDEEIIVISDYYEKERAKETIVMLADNQIMTKKEHKEFLDGWDRFEQPPVVIAERETFTTQIKRYRICDTEILEESITDYDSLPIVFFDGNSILAKAGENSNIRQVTRPIVYQAKGAQKMKNLAGQVLANEIETLMQSKFMIPGEGIHPDYKDAWKTPQKASTLVYNAFKDDDPNIPLPPPQVVQRTPIPPELSQTFMGMDTTIQNILGSFDPSIAKLGEREVSGIAIQESLSLSNSAAMPYVIGYLKGLQGVANRILELIPKVYVTPRTIPVLTKEGKKDYVLINQEGGIEFDYDKDALQVKVTAGPSFGSQQAKALKEMTSLMQVSPQFAQFMTVEGLPTLLDNMDFRGIDALKKKLMHLLSR